MSIYCPLAEKLGIETSISILDYKDYAHENAIVPGIRKGMSHTCETKELMSKKRKEHLKDNPGPMSGKKHSEETKRKMRESRIKYLDTNEGKEQYVKWQSSGTQSLAHKEASRRFCLDMNSNPEKIRKTAEKNRGQKRSPETRAKMSEARKKYLQSLKNGE